MCLLFRGKILAFAHSTIVQAAGTAVRIARAGMEIARFEVEAPVEWLKVAPDGRSTLIYGARARRAWVWNEDAGLVLFAAATGARDVFGCGFVVLNGEVLTVLAQNGALRGFSSDGHDQFAANLKYPASFHPRSFVQLPGGRLALAGALFSDIVDTVVTISLDALVHDPDVVQQAIRTKPPVWDRAVDLAVGPCEPAAAVVLRDPEDTEVPDDEEDVEDLSDVGNFAGIYVRDLDSGTLIERHPYLGGAGSGAPIAATDDWIAIQVVGGINLIRRGSGALHEVSAAALDIVGLQVARIGESDVIEIVPVEALL